MALCVCVWLLYLWAYKNKTTQSPWTRATTSEKQKLFSVFCQSCRFFFSVCSYMYVIPCATVRVSVEYRPVGLSWAAWKLTVSFCRACVQHGLPFCHLKHKINEKLKNKKKYFLNSSPLSVTSFDVFSNYNTKTNYLYTKVFKVKFFLEKSTHGGRAV